MANVAVTSAYGQKLRAYDHPRHRILASVWARNKEELQKIDQKIWHWDQHQGLHTQRDTVALCQESSHRRVFNGINWATHGKLLGRDVEPKVGMMVRLTKQGLERRIQARKGGACGPTARHFREKSMARPYTSENGGSDEIGMVVAVPSHGGWTCSVKWANGETGSGYSCGGQGGKSGRAFHLEAVEAVSQQPVRILSEREVKRMANAQFRAGSVKVIS